MKKRLIVFSLFISGTIFGQIEQNVNKTTGTESNPISETDSIRFNAGYTEMRGLILFRTLVITNVTFSGKKDL